MRWGRYTRWNVINQAQLKHWLILKNVFYFTKSKEIKWEYKQKKQHFSIQWQFLRLALNKDERKSEATFPHFWWIFYKDRSTAMQLMTWLLYFPTMYVIGWVVAYFISQPKGIRKYYLNIQGRIIADLVNLAQLVLWCPSPPHTDMSTSCVSSTDSKVYTFSKHSNNLSFTLSHVMCCWDCYIGRQHKKHGHELFPGNTSASPGGHIRSEPLNVCLWKH